MKHRHAFLVLPIAVCLSLATIALLGAAMMTRPEPTPDPVIATMGSGWHHEPPPQETPILGAWFDEQGRPRYWEVEMVGPNAWEISKHDHDAVRCLETTPPEIWTEPPRRRED